MSDFATSLAAAKAKGPKGAQKSSTVPELANFRGAGLPGWSAFMPDERELSDMWRGQQRIETVESMLNHHQVAAIRQAIRLPTHRYIIELDPGELDGEASERLGADLDTPLLGSEDEQRPGRRSGRFSQRKHFDRAQDALDYGHAVFEHTGRYDEQGYWRLTDLPPVPQWTIPDANSWEPDRHGNLVRVIQWDANPPIKLPVEHLVVFTWQGRPGDPRGRSMLRPLTGAWTMADRTMRVMGMSAERTGMGIPVGKVGTAAVAGAKEKMSALLGGMAAGHDSHLVLDTDGDIRQEIMLMGVTGQTPDLVGMLRYYDEVMARATLAMLLQLGQTQTGSRALGGTFDDLLAMFHDTIVDWYCDTMTQQLIERWVDRNRGEEYLTDGVMPRLVWSRREEDEDDEEEPATDPAAPDDDVSVRPPVAARRREHGTAMSARRAMNARARRPAALDAPQPSAVRDRVREAHEDLSLGKAGTVTAEHVAADGALVYDVAWDDGTVGQRVRQFDLRRLDRPAPPAAKLAEIRQDRPTARATRAAFASTTGRDLRRDPTPVELAAGADFATIEAQYVATRAHVASALIAVRDELTTTAVEQVAVMEAVDPLTLGETLAPMLDRHAEEMDSAPLVALLVAFAAAGVNQVVGEAARQGVTLTASIDYTARAEADARDLMRRMARQVGESAASAARTGVPAGSQGWPAAQLISDHLGALTSAAAEQAAAGAVSRAQNAGRAAAIEAGEAARIVGSEVLDQSTCGPCLLIDGNEWPSLDAALEDYPMGGYRSCEGRERCRGMLFALFAITPELDGDDG